MAIIRKLKTSPNWIAQWCSGGKTRSRSTNIRINPVADPLTGRRDTPAQAKLKAMQVADMYESAEKGSVSSDKIRASVDDLIGGVVPDSAEMPTVRVWFDRIFEEKSGVCAVGTMKCYRTAYREFVSFNGFGERRIDRITKKNIADFIAEMLKVLSANTVRRHMECIGAAFSKAYDAELINRSPALKYDIPKARVIDDRQSHDSFSRDQVDLLLRELPFEWRSMVLFSLYTGGQRISDIQRMTWDMVNLEDGIIEFYTAKTRHRVYLPIVGPLMDHIHTFRPEDRVGFIHKRFAKMRQTSLSNAFITHVIRLGLTERPAKGEGRRRNMIPLSFHSLRATAVTMMYEAGVSETIVKEIVGHESEAVNRIYRKFKSDTLARALESIK